MNAVVTVRDVTRTYSTVKGDVPAVDGVSLAVAPGEIVGVAGPSGSGKSTLLRLVAGLERPDGGEVLLGGQPLWPAGARRARMPRPGFVMPVFQDPYASLDPRWPIWRSLTEPLTAPHRADRPDRTIRRSTAGAALERARLGQLDPEARPHEMSGGQCQRVAILRALIGEPALVVADEPTARQDTVTSAAVAGLFREAAANGTAIIVVSHDHEWLATVARRTMHLRVQERAPGS